MTTKVGRKGVVVVSVLESVGVSRRAGRGWRLIVGELTARLDSESCIGEKGSSYREGWKEGRDCRRREWGGNREHSTSTTKKGNAQELVQG